MTGSQREGKVTAKQASVLKFAMDCGFFDENCKVSMTDLAWGLGKSRSSLSGTLRRGIRNAVIFYTGCNLA